jgi:hypothetical protein
LWKIGNSQVAPRFNVVEKPNDWVKEMKAIEDMSETRRLQLSFWQAFKQYVSDKPEFTSNFNLREAAAQRWYTLSVGNSDCALNLVVLARENKVRIGVRIKYNKELYMKFFAQKENIAQFLSCTLKWRETSKGGVFQTLRDANINEGSSGWDSSFDWYCETAILFKQMLKKFDV